MYHIVRSKRFDKSLERLVRTGFPKALQNKLMLATNMLARGERLPVTFRDHALLGDMGAYRECHIGGDVLLIYTRQSDVLILELVDIGSHSQLFG